MLSAPSVAAAPELGERLRARLTGFNGFLHANGFGVGGGDGARLLATAMRVGVLDRELLQASLKTLLCGRLSEWRRFDALFDAYFLPPNKRLRLSGATPELCPPPGAAGPAPAAEAAWAQTRDSDRRVSRDRASREESLATTDFQALGRADEVRDLELLMRQFARRLKRLQLRRETHAARGRRLDLQSTIRLSVERGGVPLSLAWKQRRRVRPRLVLLLDVSRSMSAYSFFYLRLARALAHELSDVHSYIFHTRLTGISVALRDADPWRAQEQLHLLAAGWGGGTRIGECLLEFSRGDASRMLHARTALVIVSDGYDTGAPEVLADALRRLRRRARRIIWINPLATRPGFSPSSLAMQAALPLVDLCSPGADLATLKRVLPQILESLR